MQPIVVTVTISIYKFQTFFSVDEYKELYLSLKWFFPLEETSGISSLSVVS